MNYLEAIEQGVSAPFLGELERNRLLDIQIKKGIMDEEDNNVIDTSSFQSDYEIAIRSAHRIYRLFQDAKEYGVAKRTIFTRIVDDEQRKYEINLNDYGQKDSAVNVYGILVGFAQGTSPMERLPKFLDWLALSK